MKNNNTMSVGRYIYEHLFWSIISMVWFYAIFFQNMNGYTVVQSQLVWVGCLLAIDVIGIWLSFQRERNYFSVTAHILLGHGTYLLLTYGRIFTQLIKTCMIIAMIITAIYLYLLFFRKIKNQRKRKAIIRSRIQRGVFAIRNGAGVAMALIMISMVVKAWSADAILDSNIPATETYGDEYSLANNIEMISNIQQEKWEKLSVQEKLDVCQVIANCEAFYLGISTEVNVKMDDLSEYTQGHYEDAHHKVVISTNHLMTDPSKEVVSMNICGMKLNTIFMVSFV